MTELLNQSFNEFPLDMNRLIFILPIFMMIICSFEGLPINWQISIDVGSDKRYEIPKGKGEYNYITFEDFKDVNNEVIANLERLKHVKANLEANGKSDTIMRWLTIGGLALTGLVGLILKIKDIQRMITKAPVQIPMSVPQMGRSSSVPNAPINYFGASSF